MSNGKDMLKDWDVILESKEWRLRIGVCMCGCGWAWVWVFGRFCVCLCLSVFVCFCVDQTTKDERIVSSERG